MKKKTLFTLLLLSLSLFALVLGTHTKVVQGVSADVQTNTDKFSSENVRILVAPDGAKGSDFWNQSNAITAIVVLHTSNPNELETYRINRLITYDATTDISRTIVRDDLQYTPSAGSYSGRKLWFFNINYDLISGKYFQILRLSENSTNDAYHPYHVTVPILFTDDLITKIWKVERAESGAGDWSPHSFSTSGTSFTGQVLVHVIEAYLTCSPSAVNGYMAYGNLQTTYNYNGRTDSPLTLKDFHSTSDYLEGRTSASGDSITLGQKVLLMKALYDASQETVTTRSNASNYLGIIIVISVVGVTTLFGFHFLRKKPRNI